MRDCLIGSSMRQARFRPVVRGPGDPDNGAVVDSRHALARMVQRVEIQATLNGPRAPLGLAALCAATTCSIRAMNAATSSRV